MTLPVKVVPSMYKKNRYSLPKKKHVPDEEALSMPPIPSAVMVSKSVLVL